MAFELRPIGSDEIKAFYRAAMRAFGEDLDPDDETLEQRSLATLPLERTFAAFDGSEMVGTGGDFEMTVSLPGGGSSPMSGLTMISVRPSHARQGILSSMMRVHFDEAHQRGEALGGLWASQAGIYRRFGYGVATDRIAVETDTRLVGPPAAPASVQLRSVELPPGELAALLAPVWNAAAATRPGMLARSPEWWEHHLLYDPPAWREGATALRCAWAESNSGPAGYALYRNRRNWEGPVSEGSVDIVELVAPTAAGRTALWSHLMRVDLFPIVKYWNLPLDDPLRWEVGDQRQLQMTGPTDALWIRLISVPKALEARSYAGSGQMTMSVTDATCPWNAGTYQLTVTDGQAVCERSAREPNLRMDVETLGALYLGGQNVRALAAAGRIDATSDWLDRFDALMRWPVMPWCPEIF